MDCDVIYFSRHAIERMFSRSIKPEDVRAVIAQGEAIEEYPDDVPYPSSLLLGFVGERPLHVVVAHNEEEKECLVITVYVPDPSVWTEDLKTRRPL
jgi:hypothetical protein